MKKLTAYTEHLERQNSELEFFLSKEGRELQLNAVAQGYGNRLFYRYLVLFGSGFIAAKMIKHIENEINEK